MISAPDTKSALLRLVREEDSQAWSELFDLYWPFLVRWSHGMGLPWSDAEDVSQQAMVRLTKAMPDFQYNRKTGRFRDYLYTILHNVIRDWFRKKKRRPRYVSIQESDQPDKGDVLEKRWNDAHDRHILQQCLQRIQPDLSQDDLLVFRLYFLEKYRAKEVSALTGQPLDSIANKAWSVLRRLRKEAEVAGLAFGDDPKAKGG